jgi:uncharacterized membrane protein YcaP (DUF421 family)
MLGADSTLLGGLCAAGTLFVLNSVLKLVMYKFPKLSGLVQGRAVMLIYNGEVLDANLKKTKISMAELEEALRAHGVRLAAEVDLAVLEANGSISVLSNEFKTRTKHKTVGADKDFDTKVGE